MDFLRWFHPVAFGLEGFIILLVVGVIAVVTYLLDPDDSDLRRVRWISVLLGFALLVLSLTKSVVLNEAPRSVIDRSWTIEHADKFEKRVTQ